MPRIFNIEISEAIAQKLDNWQNRNQFANIEDAISNFIEGEIDHITSLDERPPRIQPSLRSAPKIKQLYWCKFPIDGQSPEFWKTRPVIILSSRQHLYSTVTVIPCSSQPQGGNKWAFPLQTTIDGSNSWAICDKITNIAVSRLTPHRGQINRIPDNEFQEILEIVLNWLPKQRL